MKVRNTFNRYCILAWVLLTMISPVAVVPAHATGTPAISYTTFSSSANQDGLTLGWEFTTAQPIYITHLGYWDSPPSGLNSTHDVGIFNLGGNLLVSATVAAGTGELPVGLTANSTFRYHDIVDFQLPAGTYRIGGTANTGGGDFWNQAPVGLMTAAGITLGDSYFVSTGNQTLTFPTSNGGPNPYSGPNFLFDIPEPSTFALLGLSGVLLLRRRR